MTVYRCPCPFGCSLHAAGTKLCENCRMGFHGRFCPTFVPRPDDESVWTRFSCAVCGGWRVHHPGELGYDVDQAGPHAPEGLVVTASPGPPPLLSRSSILPDPDPRGRS